jgi:uncharacterized membrane protein YgcG
VALPGLLTPFPDPQASAALSLLGTHQLGTAPGTVTPTPTAPVDPATATNAWAAAMNQNAYGTDDPAKLGLLGSAGFPLWNDPRLVQDHLAQLAQGTITAPGVTQQAAEDEFRRQMAMANRNYGGGGGSGWGGGEGEMGSGGGGASASGGGQGEDASGSWG